MPSSFSERTGAVQPRRDLQIGAMDQGLRTALWNFIYLMLDAPEGTSYRDVVRGGQWLKFARLGLWDEFMHLPVDEIPSDPIPKVKAWFMAAPWYSAYDLAEYVMRNANAARQYQEGIQNPEKVLNRFLEREMSGYRAVRGEIVPITSDAELDAVKQAATPRERFAPVAEHIDAALRLLGLKPEPDYRNSVKESISAVEAAVKLLTGENSGGIDKALAILEQKGQLHGAMKVGLSKLYAYTSDKDGVRHALLDEATVTFAEAKFMLVACSAFANFLIETASRK